MELSVDQLGLKSPENFSVKAKKTFDGFGANIGDSADSPTRIEEDFNINEESCIHTVQNLWTRNLIFEYSGNIETFLSEEDEHREAIHDPYIRKFSYNFSPDQILHDLTLVAVQNEELLVTDRKTYKWQLQDIVLHSLIKKGEFHSIWSAENRVLNEQCSVQIILKDYTELIHNDFSKTQVILEKLKEMTEMHCFSISEEDDFLVILLVHEPIHFTLQEYFNFRLKREEFNESEILQILGEIQGGFEAYLKQGIYMDDISLENIFISKNNYSIKLGGFALKLPIIEVNEDLHRKYADKNVQKSREAHYVKSVSMLAFQLITMNKDTNFSVNKIEKDIAYQSKYRILMYLLGLRWDVQDFQETLKSIYSRNSSRNYKSLKEMRKYHQIKTQEIPYFEMMKIKDRGYRYLQNPRASLGMLEKIRQALQKKQGKTKNEYYQYLICVNRSLAHYIKLENMKEIFEIKSQMNSLTKTNEIFNKVKTVCNRDFAEHIFLIGQVQQQFLKNTNQAKKIYEEGIVYCRQNQVTANNVYSSALKKMIKICQEMQDDFEVLKYSEDLKDFYSQKDGRYLEKGQLYQSMGTILARQGDYGRALKLFISSFEMYQKRIITKKEVFIEVLEDIIEACENLKDDDVAIKYLAICGELKKEMYGEISREYANVLKRASEVHLRNQGHALALEHYLNYLALVEKLSGICSEKYANALLFLSEIYLGMDNYEKALEAYDEYVSLCPEWNQAQGIKSFMLMDKMANVLFKKEDFRGSIEVQLQSLSIKEMIFGKMSKYYFVSLNNIGDTYFGCGQFAKALEYHLRCFNIVKCDTKNAKNSDYVQVLLNIAYDYERMENYGKAVEYLYQSLQLNSTRGILEIESIVDEYEALNTLKKKRLITLDFNNIVIQTNMSFN